MALPIHVFATPAAIMQSEPNIVQTPFQISVADRVKRLPPYLFGKINDLKYRKRRAGVDVIDLGMGNPTDTPDPQVIDKLCEAVRDERNHRYSVSNGLFNLRREVALQRLPRLHGVQASSASPTPKCWPASAPRKSSATCAWPCSVPATRQSCRRRRSPSTSTPSPWPPATSSASTAPGPTASCPTSPTSRSIFIPNPRC